MEVLDVAGMAVEAIMAGSWRGAMFRVLLGLLVACGGGASVRGQSLQMSAGATVTYALGDAPCTLDSDITITDGFGSTLSSGTVTIGAGFVSGDTLGFSNTSGAIYGNINAAYDTGTGVLTLYSQGAAATVAQWQTAFESVTFSTSSYESADPTRTISYSVTDGTNTSVPVLSTVDTTPGTAPVVTCSPGLVTCQEGEAQPIDSALTVTDAESPTITRAVVTISQGGAPGDVLQFTPQNGITGSYDLSAQVLTLTGTAATVAQWQSALQSVGFQASSSAQQGSRTIGFVVSDPYQSSSQATRMVSIPSGPYLQASIGTPMAIPGGSPVAIAPNLVVGDGDTTSLARATVTISAGAQLSDALQFAASGSFTSSYDAASWTLTLVADPTTPLGAWQAALQSVAFSAGNNDAPASPTVTFQVFDGWQTSNTIDQTVQVPAGPSLALAGPVLDDTPGAAMVPIAPSLTVADGESASLAFATVAITSGMEPGDVLGFSDGFQPGFSLAASYGLSGVLTLSTTGSPSLAQWQAVLEAVGFSSVATTQAGPRTVGFMVNDGMNTSNTVSQAIQVGRSITLTPTSLPGGTATLPYSETLDALGGPSAFTYQVTTGRLPTGLTLDANSGTLEGTPTATGRFPFTVTATDQNNDQVAQQYTLSIASKPLLVPGVTLTTGGGGYAGQTATLTAQVTGSGQPTGLVQFVDGSTTLGSAQLNGGLAVLTTPVLAQGSHTFTAQYQGDGTFASAGSDPVGLVVAAPALVLSSGPGSVSIGGSGEADASFNLSSLGTPGGLVTLSASGQPQGLTVTFSPPSLGAAALPTSVGVHLHYSTGSPVAGWSRPGTWLGGGGLFLACGMLVIPLGGLRRRRLARVLGLTLAALAAGCSSGKFSSADLPRTYPVTITATAAGTVLASQVLDVTVP